MVPSKTGVPASQLARDFGVMLSDFITQVDRLLTRPLVEGASPPADIRREVCVAVWASITAAFEASSLSREEKDRLAPLLHEKLVPLWDEHCASDPQMAGQIAARASNYLQGRDPRSQVATASAIVKRLLDEIGAAGEPRRELTRRLIPMFAHRMLGDTYHIDDLKTRFGIQLPVLATMCFTAGFTHALEPALRMLRLA